MKDFVKSIFVVSICCLAASSAMADYVNPPDWGNDTDFTHQSWEFNPSGWEGEDPIEPVIPLVADSGYSNPFGDPTMLSVEFTQTEPGMAGWTWIPMAITTERRGMYGGMQTDVIMTFEIPNYERAEPWKKQIWLQTAYFGCTASAGDVVSIEFAANADFTNPFSVTTLSEDIEELFEPPGSASRWYRYTGLFELDEQPGMEYIRVTVCNDTAVATMVDEVDIDTRCIPEPATMVLLGLGSLFALARRRKQVVVCNK